MKYFAPVFILLTGCILTPDVDPPASWYSVTTTMEERAALWEETTISCVDSHGLLLYTSVDPSFWSDSGLGYDAYLESHDIADLPAWHGRFLAATAFAMASDGKDRNDLILRLANGLHMFYEVTGIPGLFGRSCIPYYLGPKKEWMEDESQDPTKYWKQEPMGWWRTGCAKNHFLGATVGPSIVLALHEQGKIALRPEVKQRLLDVLLPAVKRFTANGFKIIDWDGKMTEFGDLTPSLIPWDFADKASLSEEEAARIAPLNGFNMICSLAIMRGAAHYDPSIKELFDKVAPEWSKGIKTSFQVLGQVIARVGHWRLEKPSFSDMEAIAFAMMGIYIWDEDPLVKAEIDDGMKGLWLFMRHERNAMFSIPYKIWVDPSIDLADVMEDMRTFPEPKHKVQRPQGRHDSHDVQPLCNRPSNSNYWKSSPFRRAKPPHEPYVHPMYNVGIQYSGQDYLGPYWLGRLFKLTGLYD